MEIYNNKAQFILAQSLADFQQTCGYVLKIGIELEFYLLDNNGLPFVLEANTIQNFFHDLEAQLTTEHIQIYGFEEEDGDNQFEIKLAPTADLLQLATDIQHTKECIRNTATQHALMADLSTTPIPGDCSNSLQFNLSLWRDDANCFSSQDMLSNELVLFSINGLLLTLAESMIFFSPEVKDYQRHNIAVNRAIYARGKQVAPINISWGFNNRTAAIRIPSFTANIDLHQDQQLSWSAQLQQKIDLNLCRIEHRVPSIHCHPTLAMAAIIQALKRGLILQQTPKYYVSGDAYDTVNYILPGFANSLAQAQHDFQTQNYLKNIFDNLRQKE